MSTQAPVDPTVARGVLQRIRQNQERRLRAIENAAKMSASFRDFIPAAWPVVEPEHPLVPSWHIDAMADHLQAMVDGYIQNLLLIVPPGSAKSVITAVMLPAWQWTPRRKPGWRSIWGSYGASISTRDSVRCRDLMRSTWYQETFQPDWSFASAQDEKTYFANTAKGFRIATSVDGLGTGFRGSCIAADDPLNAKERQSEAALRACIDWWENVVFNRLDDMSTGNKLVVMQRLNHRDLAGHILSKSHHYETLIIPMEYDPKRSRVTSLGMGREWRDPREKPGMDPIMCPEKFPPKVIEELKSRPLTWETQYQQNPQADGGGILPPHKWNYWRPPGQRLPAVRVKMPDGSIQEREAIELPDQFDLVLQTWDFAFKDTKTSDYACGQVQATRGSRRFILRQRHGRMTCPMAIQAVREMTGEYPQAHLKLIEEKANGAAVMQMLETEISGMIPVNPLDGKVSRASAAAVELEAGNWYLPHPMIAPWVGNPESPEDGGGFLAEAVAFPPVPGVGHDDMVDAWSQGANRIQAEKFNGIFQMPARDIRIEPFDLKLMQKWPRAYGLSINHREIGAVWLSRNPQTSQHYLWAEYFSPVTDPGQHAAAIKTIGGDITGFLVADAEGREAKDGYALARRYNGLGLRLESTLERHDAAVVDLIEGLRTGTLKVFGSLGRFFDQYVMYRRDDRGKLPLNNVALVEAALVIWSIRDRIPNPEPPRAPSLGGLAGPTNSWMSS
jgi:predicted phage terminase large subunit-like protein